MRTVLLALLCTFSLPALAQEVKREVIYGAEMMTRAEREEFRYDMLRAKTPEEADKVRARHREHMQRRARARGDKLNDMGMIEKPPRK